MRRHFLQLHAHALSREGTPVVGARDADAQRAQCRLPGVADRGRIAPGLRAHSTSSTLLRDLPAGGKRFVQTARGYLGSWVAGQAVQRNGEVSDDARPGRLVRGAQSEPVTSEVATAASASGLRNVGIQSALEGPGNQKSTVANAMR